MIRVRVDFGVETLNLFSQVPLFQCVDELLQLQGCCFWFETLSEDGEVLKKLLVLKFSRAISMFSVKWGSLIFYSL